MRSGNVLPMTEPEKKIIEAERVKALIKTRLKTLEEIHRRVKKEAAEAAPEKEAVHSLNADFFTESKKVLSFLDWLSLNFNPSDARRGIDPGAVEDFLRLMEVFLEPEKWKAVTTRSLSAQLYRDSKRLEFLLDFASPFLAQAQKQGLSIPDISILQRSFPEVSLAGKLIFEFASPGGSPQMTNDGGIIVSLPLSSILEIGGIKTILPKENPSVVTIENKETFYVLGSPWTHPEQTEKYDCYLYTGGFPNRAAAAMIRLLSASGFSFFHAGDLDIDGILILQNIMDIAGKSVTPLCMDAATFDRYLPWARPLTKEMFRQEEKIRSGTRAIPGLEDMIRRIKETSRGVEQEIIDYRIKS